MQEQLHALKQEIEQTVSQISDLDRLESVQTEYLGRKGKLTSLLKRVSELPSEERPTMGAFVNEIKRQVEALIAAKQQELQEERLRRIAESEREDITEPGLRPPEGHLHLVTHAINEITTIFDRVGFTRVRYPEVEWDWYAFEALNMPPDHPARDEWETFFMDVPLSTQWGKGVLTPHATSGTARILAEKQLPIRAINISKTYRRQMDITHVPMFHQFDGVYVDKGVAITHLRGILDYFVKAFFGPERQVRLRPFHFRFTEPSFEIDVSCGVCGGTGILNGQKCRTCKRGWLELGGCGMLHPNVLRAAKIDPNLYSGLAFGWGVERTYMMKEGMHLDDIRMLYKNDLRFLQQF